jgi:NAD+ synthase
MPGPIPFRGVRLGVPICEDIWTPTWSNASGDRRELLLVPNGSPFEAGKEDVRLQLVPHRVTESGLALAYLNQVGGQDELVFDGASFVSAMPVCSCQAPSWRSARRHHRMARGGQRLGDCARASARPEEDARGDLSARWCWACATT